MKLTSETLSLLFILLSSSSQPSIAQSNPPNPPVLDITHSPLSTNIKYYILPVIRGRGGSVSVSTATCPPAVIQDPFEVSRGLPVSFMPFDGEKGVIRESTDVNIKFFGPGHANLTSCKDSTSVWRVDGYDEKTRQWYVMTGGVEGNPGRQTVSNWFKIDKSGEEDYKLVFCPSVCSFCKVVCKDVGVYVDKGGNRRLVLSDEPLVVMFKKA